MHTDHFGQECLRPFGKLIHSRIEFCYRQFLFRMFLIELGQAFLIQTLTGEIQKCKDGVLSSCEGNGAPEDGLDGRSTQGFIRTSPERDYR